MKTKTKFSRRRKAYRWINTRFALPYKKRVMYARLAASAILSSGIAKISAIKFAPVKEPKDRVLKALAIANEVISTMQNTCLAFQGLTYPSSSNTIGIK